MKTTYLNGLLFSIGLATAVCVVAAGQTVEFKATGDVWIREASPTHLAYENDLISVWSSHSNDGARRYGLIEFDLSSLAGVDIAEVKLSLYSGTHGFSDYTKPLKQKSFVINCPKGITLPSLSWNSYMGQLDPTKVSLAALGAYNLPAAAQDPAQQNKYVVSVGTSGDTVAIQAEIDRGGRVCMVLTADEQDGLEYAHSWGDDGWYHNPGYPAILTVNLANRKAYAPTPSDRAAMAGTDAVLSWKAGLEAISHDVYFGTNQTDVLNATDPDAFPGRGRKSLDDTSFDPGDLDHETTYYWRIDEVTANGITKGDIWSFTTITDPAVCPTGDRNGDCVVDLADLMILAQKWCTEESDLSDFALLAHNWRKRVGPVVISEFLASNGSTLPLGPGELLDGNNESSDWIELFNPSELTQNLGGWYLTDDVTKRDKWRLPPGVSIKSGEYLIVFASQKKQQDYPGNYPYVDSLGYLHTNFALSAGGEYLGLIGPDGKTIVHEYTNQTYSFGEGFPPQERDISYGLYNNRLRYFAIPTPGKRNDNAFLDLVADTTFSHSRGFYTAPFNMSIICATSDATIYYTTDGSSPMDAQGNPTPTAVEYTVPVPIRSTTCLRAAAVKPGWRPSNVDSQTCLFANDIVGQAEMDKDVIGPGDLFNGVYASTIKEDLQSIPTLSIAMNQADIFGPSGIYTNPQGTGIEWERPCSAELISPAGEEGFQANCGIRVFGQGGRTWPKKSFRLLFKETYGPTKLAYKLFPDATIEQFDTLILQSTVDTSWVDTNATVRQRAQYIRDQWTKDTARDMGQELALHSRYAHLYFNGTYWGLYAVTERPDASYMAENLGGDKADYDAIVSGDTIDGTLTAWNELIGVANAGLGDGVMSGNITAYEVLGQRLDVDMFIDYILANLYNCNIDWPGHLANRNWRAAGPREPGHGGFRVFSWDAEICFDSGWYDTVRPVDYDNVSTMGDWDYTPARLYQRLRTNTEYRMRFADRAHRHLFNGGALTPQKVRDRWMTRAGEIDRAVVAESARWGDEMQSVPLTRNIDWMSEQNRLLTQWFPNRSNVLVDLLRKNNLYPSLDAPVFNVDGAYQHGGFISENSDLTITLPANTGGQNPPVGAAIYYTTDGSDPRLPGGAINANTAHIYSGAIRLAKSTDLKARAYDSNTRTWSALNEAVFATGNVRGNLRITEIMYHPEVVPNGRADAEFIELRNIGDEPLDLDLVRFTKGIDFVFGSQTLLPNASVIVVKDEQVFRQYYPHFAGLIAGVYAGRLADEGERIRLEDAVGNTILDFIYKDGWQDIADGGGFSLTVIAPAKTPADEWGLKRVWRASVYTGGSPGVDDSGLLPNPGDLVINEVLAHSHAQAPDWIELYNTTNHDIDLDGWFLSDSDSDEASRMKYEIHDVRIPGGGFVVFREDLHFNNAGDSGCRTPFGLSENGEVVCLSSPADGDGRLTGYRCYESFGASSMNVAFGRYRTSTGDYDFVPMAENTPGASFEGAANAAPKVGPIVISEIMFHPDWPANSPFNNDDFEYIELLNISDSAVTFENNGVPWKFTRGIDFVFPPSARLNPGGRIIVAANPEAFSWRYPFVLAELVLGPFEHGTGLSNSGEAVELSMPGDSSGGIQYYIRADYIRYSDGNHGADYDGHDPWPADTDGNGKSLTRPIPARYGNDPMNWQASLPSPGF